MNTKLKHINLAGLNLVMYSLLVVATPFIMLQNYLQGFIQHLSRDHTNITGISVPTILLIFVALLVVALILFRRAITLKNLMAPLLVFTLISIGQWISDYYIDFKYYDLQNNWHYFAYFLFAFISWSFFKQKRATLHRMLIYTWLMALSISLFDELFRHGMSQRIFDLSDVAKDLWGTSIGLCVITFWIEKTDVHNFKIRQNKIKDYFGNSLSTMVLLLISSFSFLVVSSLLTDQKYAGFVVLVTFIFIGIAFLIIHHLKGWKKKLILGLIGVLIAGQLVLVLTNSKSGFIFHNNFLSVYRGWFMPFFDVMVFPDKTFRFVDKKLEFNNTDKKVLMKTQPDVILIGAGKNKEGGNGFPTKENTHFILNPDTRKPVQVIILESREACLKYNELSEKGIKTVMVIHKSL